jgi:hypothetical protein
VTTHLIVDDNLLEEARNLGKHATKKAAVNEALVEYIQRRKQQEIIGLFNTIEYGTDHDCKSQRKKQ